MVMISNKYRVRVLIDDSRGRFVESVTHGLTYQSAVELFRFYVDCTLEFNLNVRCVNIMLGKRSIKLFQNH